MNGLARRLVVIVAVWGWLAAAVAAPAGAQSAGEPAVPESAPAVIAPVMAPVMAPVVAPVVVMPPPVPAVIPAGPFAELIAARLSAPLGVLDSRRPPDAARLRRFYEHREYRPLWFSDAEPAAAVLSPRAKDLQAVTAASETDALLPADYHPAAIAARLEAVEPARRAELDLLLTDALMSYAVDLRRGRLVPHAIAEEFAQEPPALDVGEVAPAALAAPDLRVFLAGLAPPQGRYTRLREALRMMRGFEKAGGWPKVPEGPKLEPGISDPVVKSLRRRLSVTGELDAQRKPLSSLYDPVLKAAVQHFQARNGLKADGVIGSQTYQALNISAAERVISIIANMERERWMPADLGPRYVLVNIAGFSLRAVEGGKAVLEMPVIVGTKVRRTPILTSEITSLIWNPTWSVPHKLAREDILPKLRENPGYLAEMNIVLYDGSYSGGKVKPDGIDWATFNDINRFRLRQMPGAHNALGQVKFNIPNGFDVYLHDTPHREKFAKPVRALSSGCVRVGNPMALADFLLTDMPEWTKERRAAVLEKGDTRFVTLHTPTPVFLLYRTAWVEESGALNFRDDVYGRDLQIFRAIRRLDDTAPRSAANAS
ncbi:MAG: L,D-transpeptidase family protein [Rhodospirillaceae bacterium]